MALEKGFKYTLSAIDEALPISGLDGSMLQDLRRAQREQKAPTLLAVAAKIETHGLVGLLHIVAKITGADIKTAILSQFVDAAQLLTDLRNRYVHAELFGEADALLNPVYQALSRLRPVCEQLAPTLWQRLREEDDQLESYVRGIEADVDGAWNVLVEYLGSHAPLHIDWEFYATLVPGGGSLSIDAFQSAFLSNAINFRAAAPLSNVAGFFAEHVTADSSRFFRGADSAQRSSLSASTDFFSAVVRLAVEREHRQSRGIGAQGLIPWSDGTIALADVDANGFFLLTALKKRFLSVNICLESLTVVFNGGDEKGVIKGHLASGITLSGSARASRLVLSGDVLLTSEYVYDKTVVAYPEGSTVRHLTVKSQLQLADQATGA
jgi:hypothetical protein